MTPRPTPGTPETRLPSGAQRVVQIAMEDLARALDLAPGEISVLSVEAVEWPDTSLGCPRPGMMYAQVITPGLRVVLEANNQSYEYHTDQNSSVVLCEGN
jgi:hypothetical protein